MLALYARRVVECASVAFPCAHAMVLTMCVTLRGGDGGDATTGARDLVVREYCGGGAGGGVEGGAGMTGAAGAVVCAQRGHE